MSVWLPQPPLLCQYVCGGTHTGDCWAWNHQGPHCPTATDPRSNVPETQTMTQDDLLALLRERFGDDLMAWAFECPNCGDVATGQDFREALAASPRQRKDGTPMTASDLLGQECIGRNGGIPRTEDPHYAAHGCNWVAWGLFRGPVRYTTLDGGEVYGFAPAPAPAPEDP